MYFRKFLCLKPFMDSCVKLPMNTKSQSFASRVKLLPAGMLLLTLAGSFLAAPTAQAEVHVGVSVGVGLPRGYSEVRVGRDRYYTQRGVFYQRGPRGGYVVVRAPRGAFIRTLPPHYTRIYVGSTVYYRYGDAYYQPSRDGYVVVDAPAAQPMPPPRPVEDYQSVWVGKQEYLFKDGQFFNKTPDGMVWVAAPLGAITHDLPSDARSVWFQNEEYFESDEVYFHKTPAGYEVVAAPWKK
jgi:Family of unknown function (DUF6515)